MKHLKRIIVGILVTTAFFFITFLSETLEKFLNIDLKGAGVFLFIFAILLLYILGWGVLEIRETKKEEDIYDPQFINLYKNKKK